MDFGQMCARITKDELPKFKKAYQDALKNKDGDFMFHGVEVSTSYAKYIIEYLDEYYGKIK